MPLGRWATVHYQFGFPLEVSPPNPEPVYSPASTLILVEGALHYEKDTQSSEPNALNTPLLATVVADPSLPIHLTRYDGGPAPLSLGLVSQGKVAPRHRRGDL